MRSRVYETVERPSVCLSVRAISRPPHAAAVFAAVGPAATSYRPASARPALSRKREQFRVVR